MHPRNAPIRWSAVEPAPDPAQALMPIPLPPARPEPVALGPQHTGQVLPLLIVGQIALHGALAGQRMAAPLQALQAGHNAWAGSQKRMPADAAGSGAGAASPLGAAGGSPAMVRASPAARPGPLRATKGLIGAACQLRGRRDSLG